MGVTLHRNTKDMTGARCGAWTVLSFAGNYEGRSRCSMWLCRCQCGFEGVVQGTALRNGKSVCCRSCGSKAAWAAGRSKPTRVRSFPLPWVWS